MGNKQATHTISHAYKDEIIVPYSAVTNNISIEKGDGVTTSDGVKATIESVLHLHMLSKQAEQVSVRLYQISPWGLMKQWYLRKVPIDSIVFLHIYLKKV